MQPSSRHLDPVYTVADQKCCGSKCYGSPSRLHGSSSKALWTIPSFTRGKAEVIRYESDPIQTSSLS